MSLPSDFPELDPVPASPQQSTRNLKRLVLIEFLALLLVASACVWTYYLSTRKPLLAALPPVQLVTKSLRPHYLFSIYGTQEPVGVAVTSDGDRIYVAESGGDRLIHTFDRDGKELFNFAPPNTQPLTRAPVYVALDSAGLVYVSDRLKQSVDTFDAGGNFKASLKPLTADGWFPLGLRWQGDNLLLTDLTDGKHRVLQMTKDGRIAMQFGHEGNGKANDELWFPNSAVSDARGRMYVSDSNNARIQVLDPQGNWLETIRGFSLPRGLAIDENQRLYVVDGIGCLVRVFDLTGDSTAPLFDFGDFGPGDGEFNYPNDIALDKTERLYIADRASNRVQVWSY